MGRKQISIQLASLECVLGLLVKSVFIAELRHPGEPWLLPCPGHRYQQLAGAHTTASQGRHLVPWCCCSRLHSRPEACGPPCPPLQPAPFFSVEISGSENYPVLLGPPRHGIFCFSSLTD